MRYHGQGHEIAVDLTNEPLGSNVAKSLQRLFDTEYRNVFGRTISNIAAAEIVSFAVTVTTEPYAAVTTTASGIVEHITHATRTAFDSAVEEERSFVIVPRENLQVAKPIAGPAIITEKETSVVVSSIFEARTLLSGDIELLRTDNRILTKKT